MKTSNSVEHLKNFKEDIRNARDRQFSYNLLPDSLSGFNGRRTAKLYGESIIRTVVKLVHSMEIGRDDSIKDYASALGTQLSFLNWYIIKFNDQTRLPFLRITKRFLNSKVFNIESSYHFDAIKQIWNFQYPCDGWYSRISKLAQQILEDCVSELYKHSLDISSIPSEKTWQQFAIMEAAENI